MDGHAPSVVGVPLALNELLAAQPVDDAGDRGLRQFDLARQLPEGDGTPSLHGSEAHELRAREAVFARELAAVDVDGPRDLAQGPQDVLVVPSHGVRH